MILCKASKTASRVSYTLAVFLVFGSHDLKLPNLLEV